MNEKRNWNTMNESSAVSARVAVLERVRAIYGADASIVKQGQMYATSAPQTHSSLMAPIETWVFEVKTGQERTMTLIATQSAHDWSVRKVTSDPDDPARDL